MHTRGDFLLELDFVLQHAALQRSQGSIWLKKSYRCLNFTPDLAAVLLGS